MAMYKELLWIFTQLPDDYIVLDTETTGLPDENGPPDIVTLGITVVRNRAIAESVEFKHGHKNTFQKKHKEYTGSPMNRPLNSNPSTPNGTRLPTT